MSNKPKARPQQQRSGLAALFACFFCVGEAKILSEQGETVLPPIQPALTMAPIVTPGGAVAVPTCGGHLPITSRAQLDTTTKIPEGILTRGKANGSQG